jgi:hypothetical protein
MKHVTLLANKLLIARIRMAPGTIEAPHALINLKVGKKGVAPPFVSLAVRMRYIKEACSDVSSLSDLRAAYRQCRNPEPVGNLLGCIPAQSCEGRGLDAGDGVGAGGFKRKRQREMRGRAERMDGVTQLIGPLFADGRGPPLRSPPGVDHLFLTSAKAEGAHRVRHIVYSHVLLDMFATWFEYRTWRT